MRSNLFILFLAILITASLAWMITIPVKASPASPLEFSLSQPDGSTFMARQWGDEWNNGFETIDGYTILKDPQTGFWVFARLQTDGVLSPALSGDEPQVVGQVDPQAIPKHLRPTLLVENPRANAYAARGADAPAGKFTGMQPTLVILVKFLNVNNTYTYNDFYNRFFMGYDDSVSAYYDEVSYYTMHITPAAEEDMIIGGANHDGVIGWLTLPYNHPNPGKGDTRQLAFDAISAANPYIDYSAYDTNDNHIISTDELHVFIIAAGYEASYAGGGDNQVWGNNWWVDYVGCPLLDGVLLACMGENSGYNYDGGYSIMGEVMDDHLSTIGVMVHEMGHDLGWPDLYNTAEPPTTTGAGRWTIMSDGMWGTYGGDDGNWPTHPGAWEKYYQGWLSPIVINDYQFYVNVPQVESLPTVYALHHNAGGLDWKFLHHSGQGDYFLLENRQQYGFDQNLPACGILIWHINETAPFDYTANNSLQPLVSLEQADGNYDLEAMHNNGDTGDPYPGSANIHVFNAFTTPDSRLYNGNSSGVYVEVLSHTCGAMMHADMRSWNNYVPNLMNNVIIGPWTTITGEAFEGGDFPKPGWNIGSGDYLVGARTCQPYQGLYSGWMIGRGPIGNTLPCGADYPEGLEGGDDVTLTYGPFSSTGASAFQLNYHYWTNLEAGYDYLYAGVSSDNINYVEREYTGNSAGWQFDTLDLRDPLGDGREYFMNLPAVWVRFRLMTDRTNNLPEGAYLDNISLRKCTSFMCAPTPIPGPGLDEAPSLNSFLNTVQKFIDPFRIH
jgi:M6 family metalloprotease-like protein